MNKRWYRSLALALAGVLLLAGAGLAQNQGGGKGPAGAGSQLCTPGPGGTCVVNPPAGNQSCPQAGAGQSQKCRGPKGPNRGEANQANPQANPPAGQ